MKSANIICVSFLIISILSCSTKNDKKIEKVEIEIDSIAIEKIFADSSLTILDPSELKALTVDLNDTSRFAQVIKYYAVVDSIKKAGGFDNYLGGSENGGYTEIKAVSIREVNWDATTTLKLWGMSYHTLEACPYSSGMTIFLSLFENGKFKSCIPFAYLETWADAPFYTSTKTISKLSKSGQITIKEYIDNGGVNEQDVEFVEKDSVDVKISLESIGLK